jgi:hypothetical protein
MLKNKNDIHHNNNKSKRNNTGVVMEINNCLVTKSEQCGKDLYDDDDYSNTNTNDF